VDHSKIITAAARSILRPAGLVQKGRSRVWLDDHGWWLVVVEFQPSGWDRGSYLNVGATYLLYPQDHLGFHDGYREHDFIAARDEAQFQPKAEALCRLALAKVESFRARLTSPAAAHDRLEEMLRVDEERGTRGPWNLYFGGALALACGRRARGEELLDRLGAAYPATTDWERELVRISGELRHTAEPRRLLAEHVRATRAAVKLPEIAVSFETPSPDPR
jgi:hypothetical protein